MIEFKIIKNDLLYGKSFFLKYNCNKSDPAGARTQDPLIKSQLLYQLSYEVIAQMY